MKKLTSFILASALSFGIISQAGAQTTAGQQQKQQSGKKHATTGARGLNQGSTNPAGSTGSGTGSTVVPTGASPSEGGASGVEKPKKKKQSRSSDRKQPAKSGSR